MAYYLVAEQQEKLTNGKLIDSLDFRTAKDSAVIEQG